MGWFTTAVGLGVVYDALYSVYRYEKLKIANKFEDHAARLVWRLPAGLFVTGLGLAFSGLP